MKKKVLLISAAVVVLLIAIYIVFAYNFHVNAKKRFADKVGYNEIYEDYVLQTEEEVYYCHLLNWWKIGGNIGISSKTKMNEEGIITNEFYQIFVPIRRGNRGYKVYMSLGYKDQEGIIQTVSFELDEHMEFLHPDDVSSVQIMLREQLMDRIKELYRKVYDMWGILGENE